MLKIASIIVLVICCTAARGIESVFTHKPIMQILLTHLGEREITRLQLTNKLTQQVIKKVYPLTTIRQNRFLLISQDNDRMFRKHHSAFFIKSAIENLSSPFLFNPDWVELAKETLKTKNYSLQCILNYYFNYSLDFAHFLEFSQGNLGDYISMRVAFVDDHFFYDLKETVYKSLLEYYQVTDNDFPPNLPFQPVSFWERSVNLKWFMGINLFFTPLYLLQVQSSLIGISDLFISAISSSTVVIMSAFVTTLLKYEYQKPSIMIENSKIFTDHVKKLKDKDEKIFNSLLENGYFYYLIREFSHPQFIFDGPIKNREKNTEALLGLLEDYQEYRLEKGLQEDNFIQALIHLYK